MDNEFTTQFEEQLDMLPEEARDFLFSDEFEKAKNDVLAMIPNAEARVSFQTTLLLFLVGVEPIETLADTIEALEIPEDVRQGLVTKLKESIFDELLLLIEVHKELDEAGPVEGGVKPVAQKEVLDSLRDRLSKTNTIAPIITPVKKEPQPQEAAQKPKPIVDIYREMPE